MDRLVLRLAIVCVTLAGLVACGGDPSPLTDDGGGTDGGGTDGGGADGGPRADSGPRIDAGPPCAAYVPGMPVPTACMPRCTPETATAYDACPADASGDACRAAALASDTHDASAVATLEGTIPLNCADCVRLQLVGCQAGLCADQFGPWSACVAAYGNENAPECADERAPLDTCITDSQASIDMCTEGTLGGSAPLARSLCFSPD